MSNENEKWRKFLKPVVASVAGFFLAATAYVQHSDNVKADVRISAVEYSVAQIEKWNDKTEVRIEESAKNIYTLNVQLAQVLVKLDNVIEVLKEQRNDTRRK